MWVIVGEEETFDKSYFAQSADLTVMVSFRGEWNCEAQRDTRQGKLSRNPMETGEIKSPGNLRGQSG